MARAGERRAGGRGAQRAQRQLGGSELGHCEQRGSNAVHVDASERGFGVIEAPQQEQPAHGDQARLERVRAIGARFERCRGLGQRPRRAAEVAQGQRHLGFRNDAARPCQLLACAEAARGAPQQIACERVIAELRYGDAAQRERRSVVAQGDELQCAERVAAGQRARSRCDNGIHGARLPRRATPDADCAERVA